MTYKRTKRRMVSIARVGQSDNGAIYEKMDANLNGDIHEVVRSYRGNMVQDAIIQLDGCKISAVHDASTPYQRAIKFHPASPRGSFL